MLEVILIVFTLVSIIILFFVALIRWANKEENGTKEPAIQNITKIERKPAPTKNVERSSNWLNVKSIDFYGSFSMSPDGKYTLGWRDGSYVLLDGDEIILQGKIERPNDGKVVDNGTFILNDWMSHEELNGTFYAFDIQENTLVKKEFQANLFNNGLSNDGKYAVCQTANSDNDDGNTLNLFDLSTGEHLWQRHPECGWGDSYEFDTKEQLIYIVNKDLGKFAYNFVGEFLDSERWHKASIEYAIKQPDGRSLAYIVREEFLSLDDQIDIDTGKEILSLLKKALQLGFDEYPSEEAMAYRTMGEIHEALDDKLKAIESYEKALELNPKVGVKRRLSALKKDT